MSSSSEILSFGPEAARYADGLPEGIRAIVSDGTAAGHALAAAALWRRAGLPFYTSIVYDHPLAAAALAVGAAIYQQVHDYDERRDRFDGIATGELLIDNRRFADLQTVDPRVMRTHRTFLLMGDALLVRSQTERQRIEYAVARPNEPGRTRENVALWPGVDSTVPEFERRPDPDSIVVWAPHLPAASTALFAFALEELKAPVFIICAGGELPATRAMVVPNGPDAGELLARAQVVVDASISDPSAALALARRGVPTCVASTSGAHEYIDGVTRYEPTAWSTILAAASAGRAGMVPQIRSVPTPEEVKSVLANGAAPEVTEGPWVTIVIPTKDRPAWVERTIRECVEKQTYNRVEVVVVNDAGEPLEDVVRRFQNARLVNLEKNVGAAAAFNAGVAVGRGDYFLDLADDDFIYPDCVSRLLEAALKTNADIVHGNMIQRFDEPSGDGYRTYGYHAEYDTATDPTATMCGLNVLLTSALVHRRVFERYGGYSEEVHANDYEFQIRAAKHVDFVHVDWFVAEMAVRNDASNVHSRNDLVPWIEDIYQRYPSGGRRYVEVRRHSMLNTLAMKRDRGGTFWEPDLRI